MRSQWARWRLKSPASWLFTRSSIQGQIKENIKAPCHRPFWGGFSGDRWIPCTKGQQRGKCFHLMTSSWISEVKWKLSGVFETSKWSSFWVSVTFLSHKWHRQLLMSPISAIRTREYFNCVWLRLAKLKQFQNFTLFILTKMSYKIFFTLQRRPNEHDGVSYDQPHDCLLSRYSGADQRQLQSSASLAVVREFTGTDEFPTQPVTRKMFPFDDVIMFAIMLHPLEPVNLSSPIVATRRCFVAVPAS